MTEQNTIQEELRSLDSNLPFPAPIPEYRVPAGYFENFAANVMSRIKEMDTLDAREELSLLSPLLNSISREMPYTRPAGYFDEIDIPVNSNSAEEELSPLLVAINRQSPYKVPTGYFEELPAIILRKAKAQQPAAKVISMSRKIYRYAAASVITGIIAVTSIIMVNNSSSNTGAVTKKWVSENAQEVDSLLELAKVDPGVQIKPAAITDVARLVKDIPEKDIQDFLNDTQIGEGELNAEDDLLLN